MGLLVAERRREIVERVERDGSVRVADLASAFGVTEETIRRDLEHLEADGKLIRSHGGAVAAREGSIETPYALREVANVAEKTAIAQAAVDRIKPGSCIALDASSSALFVARLLPDIPLTVVTNAMRIAAELAHHKAVKVLMLGGWLSARSMSFVGPLAERSVRDYRVSQLFLSAKACSPQRGLSESNESQAQVKREMIGAADEVIALCDVSKFGMDAFVSVAPWSAMTTLITNEGLDAETIQTVRDAGVEIFET